MLYEKFFGESRRLMLQNEINEVELIFPAGFSIECFILPGLVYIAQGELKSKDVQLVVKKFTLP